MGSVIKKGKYWENFTILKIFLLFSFPHAPNKSLAKLEHTILSNKKHGVIRTQFADTIVFRDVRCMWDHIRRTAIDSIESEVAFLIPSSNGRGCLFKIKWGTYIPDSSPNPEKPLIFGGAKLWPISQTVAQPSPVRQFYPNWSFDAPAPALFV